MDVLSCKYVNTDFVEEFGRTIPLLEFDKDLVIDQWHRNDFAKQVISSYIFQRILSLSPRSILEIGGGISSFSHALANKFDYRGIDLMAHNAELDAPTWLQNISWREIAYPSLDLILAIDLFPNVDQGIAHFFELTKNAKLIIMTLTLQENPIVYPAKRLNGDEILTYIPWGFAQIGAVLSNNITTKLKATKNGNSPFKNGRDVWILELSNER